jgi:hypothetical protein
MADHIEWPGISGRTYAYWILPGLTTSDIQSVPGNYIFVKLANGLWYPLYMGIADNLSARLSNHEVTPQASALGATHVLAHVNRDRQRREFEERDLIARWNPPLNTHHRTGPTRKAG